MTKKSRLAQFVADAKDRVAAGAYAPTGSKLASNGSLAAATDRPDAVIAELKPRSPSEGRLLQSDPEQVLADFVAGGAAALSILTDADHFDGDPHTLRLANATGLPVLMKDFIVDERQIDVAAHHGASAILLIERCLSPQRREELVMHAHAAGLEVLLELFDDADLAAAHDSNADLFGVNARNLETLETDSASSYALIARASKQKPTIALSGVQRRRDRLAACQAGARAVLVGTSLLSAPSPRLALASLRRPLAKVCGITNDADLQAAITAGADLVGFVTGSNSPRSISPLAAQQLADASTVPTVLVTSHEDAWEVREWCRVVRPTFVQLHNLRPDEAWIHSLGAVNTSVLWAGANTSAPGPGAGYVLDTLGGGSGQTHDWRLSRQRIDADSRFNLIAGGLAADNAAQAVLETGADGADASSRLEASPGKKSQPAVEAFIRCVHEVSDA